MHERDSLTDIAPSPTWRLTPRGRRAESTIPLLVGEALDTDAALKLLAKDQAAALVARYCTNGRRLDQARRLRIRVRKFYRLLAWRGHETAMPQACWHKPPRSAVGLSAARCSPEGLPSP